MGYHANVQNALVAALEVAVPGVAVLNGLSLTVAQGNRLAQWVSVHREGIDFEPHLPIMPADDDDQQPEAWTWFIDVKGGGGTYDKPGAGAEVDLLLEAVRTGLGAQSMTADCGPLHLVSEDYEGESGTGVVYRQTWTHERM